MDGVLVLGNYILSIPILLISPSLIICNQNIMKDQDLLDWIFALIKQRPSTNLVIGKLAIGIK